MEPFLQLCNCEHCVKINTIADGQKKSPTDEIPLKKNCCRQKQFYVPYKL